VNGPAEQGELRVLSGARLGLVAGLSASVLMALSVFLPWVRTTVRVDAPSGLPGFGVPAGASGFPLVSTAPGLEPWFGQGSLVLAIVAVLLLLSRRMWLVFAVSVGTFVHGLLALVLYLPQAGRAFGERFEAQLASLPSAVEATVGGGVASPGPGVLLFLFASYLLFASTACVGRGRVAHLRIADFVNAATSRAGTLVAWLALGMVLVGAYNAVARKLDQYSDIHLSSNALIETQWYMFSLVFLLAAAWTLQEDGHVRVDVFYGRLSARGKAWVDLSGTLLFLLPFCACAIWFSLPLVENSWSVREVSPDPGGLARYPLKTFVPLAFVLVAMQGHSEVVRCIQRIVGDGDAESLVEGPVAQGDPGQEPPGKEPEHG